MNTRSYRLCALVVGTVVVVVLFWAVRTGDAAIAVVTLVVAVGILYLCRMHVEEGIEDERVVRINERAAKRALEVFVLLGILGAVMLYAISTPAADFAREGLALGLAVTALLLLYAAFQTDYSRLPGAPR